MIEKIIKDGYAKPIRQIDVTHSPHQTLYRLGLRALRGSSPSRAEPRRVLPNSSSQGELTSPTIINTLYNDTTAYRQ